ncbi:MAG TPA: metallophosphoesterase [Bacteroidia bacterium]|nr:metallophosphoesterase [Bacteroidia bacterium]HNT79225.1 metallophosphoesterase [Bacteroidia bacterium]
MTSRFKNSLFGLIILTAFCHPTLAQFDTLIAKESVWKYNDTGFQPANNQWRWRSYNDASWASGVGQLGYGDGDEATVLSFGPDPNNKYITTYFRKEFYVSEPAIYNYLLVQFLRDDGIQVFLNNKKIVKHNMPSGTITHNTKARSNQTGLKENKYWQYNRPSELLKKGKNVIAVEVHQFNEDDVDLGFDLALIANFTPCPKVVSLAVDSISQSSAFVSWSATSATKYIVELHNINGLISIDTAFQNSHNLNGLNAGSLYKVNVTSDCGLLQSIASSVVSFVTKPATVVNDTIIASGSLWKYFDSGNVNDTSWNTINFNDSIWMQGISELGYGDGDENTIIGFGNDTLNKNITSYFRKKITINNSTDISQIKIDIIRDDGAVIYSNGSELIRSNMPVGSISYGTLSSTSIGEPGEYTWESVSLATSNLVDGENIIAVEVHQSSPSSSDLSFNMRMIAVRGNSTELTRGPYLQMLSENRVDILTASNLPAQAELHYGTTMEYGNLLSDTLSTKNKHFSVLNLMPATRYYYALKVNGQFLAGGSEYYFETAPINTSTAFRFWATGDFGNGSVEQAQVRDAYINYTQNQKANFWIWLGDNAYDDGTESEFENNVFNVYPKILRNTPVFPSLGNHDYADIGYQSSTALTDSFAYFDLFALPSNGESGGVASNSEKYYSYNYGNTHFVVLDSYGSYNDTSSAMYQWLASDLAQNTKQWIVCYWHHPPYTMGSHNSDTEIESQSIRENIIPLLESYHVDLVLSGHSHNYERSCLVHGHYGLETSLLPSMLLDTSSGLTPYYTKSNVTGHGTVYAVVGNSGTGGTTSLQASWPHDIMYSYYNGIYGSLIVDIHEDTLDAKYITSTGLLYDQFKMVRMDNNSRMVYDASTSAIDPFRLEIYPNPAQSEFFVGLDGTNLKIFDISGKLVESKDLITKGEKINISRLPAGIYLVRMESEGKLLKEKLEIK